jgi:enoyl-CoA hydratase
MSDVVLYEVADRVATVTMNRPEVRNALNADLRRELPAALQRAEDDADVDVVILTGADPAFCAGIDLKELGASAPRETSAPAEGDPVPARPFPAMTKPVIGAVNGVAVTGGFELALNCSFLVASERARFADTHARVGVMPGWGLAVLLPQAVGVRKARELSLTGNYLTAQQAYDFGLVNHVVAHDELLPFCRRLAADIVGNDPAGVRQMLATYEEISGTTVAEGWKVERRIADAWQQRTFDPAEIERRRQGIIERGRAQTKS